MSSTDVKPTLDRHAEHMAEESDHEGEENSDEDEDEVLFSTQVTFSCAKKDEGGGVGVATTYRFELAVREYDGPEAKCVSGKLFVATPTTTNAGAAGSGSDTTRPDPTAEAAKKKARVEKETQVGLLEGYLVKRPCGWFYEVCDSVSAELQHISTTFCDDEGRASRVKHPTLQKSKGAVQGGGLLQIYIVELQHSHRGTDVGLRMVHEILKNLKAMWSLAVVVPCPLSGAFRKYEDPSYKPVNDKISNILTPDEEDAHAQATVKVQKHFARLGFLQAGQTPTLAEFFFATRDSYFKGKGDPWNRLLSRDQVGALDLYTKPAPLRMKDVDKELRMLLERHALNASGDVSLQQFFLAAGVMRPDRVSPPNGSASAVLAKIRDLVQEKGASINGARAVHCAAEMGAAQLELLVELLHLGGDPSLPDELGNTPLHAAANASNLAAIKLLKLAGANTGAVNAEGETPLDRYLGRQKNSADFASTFGLPAGFARKPDLGPMSEAIQLLVSPDKAAPLIDGAITPRMRWYLTTCAEMQHDLPPHLKDYQEFVPPSVLARLPGGKLSEEHERGMSAALWACLQLLYEKSTLSVSAVRDKALGGTDRGSVQAMLDAGLKIEFVLDYVFHGAEESFRTGEGYIGVDDVEEFQEQLAAIAPHPLDACYDIAFYICCSKGGEPLEQRGPFEFIR